MCTGSGSGKGSAPNAADIGGTDYYAQLHGGEMVDVTVRGTIWMRNDGSHEPSLTITAINFSQKAPLNHGSC